MITDSDRIELDLAKERLRIPELWRILSLPGEPATRDGVKFCSPLRPDAHPSCSFYDGCKRMKDWSTGGDYSAVDFLGEALGLCNGEAIRKFKELANCQRVSLPVSLGAHPAKRTCEPRPSPDLSAIEPCSQSDLWEIAKLRSIPLTGLELARARKLLFAYFDPRHGPCWLITDDAGVVRFTASLMVRASARSVPGRKQSLGSERIRKLIGQSELPRRAASRQSRYARECPTRLLPSRWRAPELSRGWLRRSA
jgi:hypothetical protein